MRPADPKAWADPYGYCPALAPKRRPPTKRSHRERLLTRTRYLQRVLKRGSRDALRRAA